MTYSNSGNSIIHSPNSGYCTVDASQFFHDKVHGKPVCVYICSVISLWMTTDHLSPHLCVVSEFLFGVLKSYRLRHTHTRADVVYFYYAKPIPSEL